MTINLHRRGETKSLTVDASDHIQITILSLYFTSGGTEYVLNLPQPSNHQKFRLLSSADALEDTTDWNYVTID
jgi:hypothetical protein